MLDCLIALLHVGRRPFAVAQAGLCEWGEAVEEGVEHLLDILMVFAGAGIGGGATDAVGRRISANETDDALGTRDEESRIHALVGVAFHVGEVAMPSATQPLVERVFVVGEGVGTGDAAVVETHGQRGLLNISAAQHTAYYLSANCAN